MYSDYGSYDISTTGSGDIFALLGGLLIFALVIFGIAIVLVILNFIGQWKAFKKAGHKGWECLIAGHNQFVHCSFVGINPIWVLFIMFGSVITAIPVIGLFAYIGLLLCYQVIISISTAKAFGKGNGFAIGLAIPLTAPIFWFILGGKNSEYIGPNPCNDPVMSFFSDGDSKNVTSTATGQDTSYQTSNAQQFAQPNVNQQNVAQQFIPSNEEQQNIKFCSVCGHKLSNGESICPNCGKEV